jgi:hypothetical protein
MNNLNIMVQADKNPVLYSTHKKEEHYQENQKETF